MTSKVKKVFLSYAKEDREYAIKIRNDLEKSGIGVWFDEYDLLPGKHWKDEIAKTIKNATYFLALLSKHSVGKRGFVQNELKIALDTMDSIAPSEIFIVPVRIDKCIPLQERLNELHRVDLFPSYDKGLSKIINLMLHDNRQMVQQDFSKHSIVIVEDHTILREGLKSLFREIPDFDVVAEAENGIMAISAVERFQPDLIIMDLSMPRMNGFEAIKEIRKTRIRTKILVCTAHNTEENISLAFEAGADGFVYKDITQDELVMAIRQVLSGKRFLNPSVSGKVIEGYLEEKKNVSLRPRMDTLTQREREVLKLIADGYKNKDVADFLCLSLKTVEKHRANVMRKLDLHSNSALKLYALERGLVTQ